MHVVRNNRLEEVDDDDPDIDFELDDATRQYGSHTNMIPLQSAVQAPRLFYGGRFTNQALAIEGGEAPLVQNLDTTDPDGRSFDELAGEKLGAVRAKQGGRVIAVKPGHIRVKYEDGKVDDIGLYDNMAFNQKSVSGDTVIVIKRGRSIWRGKIADYEWEKGDKVASYDPSTLRSAWQEVRCKIAHDNDKRMMRVRYSSGREVSVTEDHSLLHFDGKAIAPILPGRCVSGVTRSPIVFGENLDNPTSKSAIVEDENLGHLVGLYLAEGDLPLRRGGVTSGAIRIAVTGAARRAEVDSLIRSLGLRPNERSPGRAVAHSRELCDWLERSCGRGAGGKCIHPSLMSKSYAFRVGLIQGFMAGDGCMESDSNGALHVHTAVTSRRLRDDLVLVLNSLGVFTTIFSRGRECYSDKWNDAHGFRIISSHLRLLPRWFFYADRHEDFLRWVKSSYRSSPFERLSVPVTRAIKAELKPLGLGGLRDKRKASLVRRTARGDFLVSKRVAKDAERGSYQKLGASDILWDTVVTVEEADFEEVVYDLQVGDAEAFAVAGGLLVHNSGITSRALVQRGDTFKPGQLVAASSYTDDNGVQNMGLNARIGLVPWKGYSMDDAIPISASFAARLKATQFKVMKQDTTDNLKTGLNHYRALFPTRFEKKKLENFDDDGLVRKGTILDPGDPVLLATMPRTLSSTGANVGKLSKALKQQRRDASQVWHGKQQAEVVAARKTKNGYKIVLKYHKPTEDGDKIVLRQGAKATVSKIIPDDQMPRTEDGQPLDALLNPLSLVSRANPASQHELRLGKIARKLGLPMKIPSYLPKGESWNDYIDNLEAEHEVESKERVFDPETRRFLAEPVTVGYGFINKLHHTSEGKVSGRGTGSYDQNEQPTRGGGEMAQAKRFSGLENFATLSSGAYSLMRENSTLRGQQNHEFWKALRADKPLPKVNEPFVWNKFRAILAGAGMDTKESGKGKFRLSPFTDKDLDERKPVDIENGELVNLKDLSSIRGGLFDDRLLSGEKWGRIKLDRPVINPAMEETVRAVLGITKKQLDEVLAGRLELAEAMGS